MKVRMRAVGHHSDGIVEMTMYKIVYRHFSFTAFYTIFGPTESLKLQVCSQLACTSRYVVKLRTSDVRIKFVSITNERRNRSSPPEVFF